VRSGILARDLSSPAAGDLPTLSVCGRPGALSIFAAFLIRTVAGGVFIRTRSLVRKAVMTTGSEARSTPCVWR